jgi:hypothetical protein
MAILLTNLCQLSHFSYLRCLQYRYESNHLKSFIAQIAWGMVGGVGG